MNIKLKKNDKGYKFNYVLSSDDNNVVNLLGCSVRFQMTNQQNVVFDNPATVENATQGVVSYTFTEADTLFEGDFIGKFIVTSGESQLTYPRTGIILVTIQPNIDVNATTVILDAIAAKQGEFETKLNDILALGKGEKGDDGDSAYQVWLSAGNTGTIDDYLLSLKGQDGSNGSNGTNGTNGANGFSPIATVEKVGDITTITVTDINGTTTAEIENTGGSSETSQITKGFEVRTSRPTGDDLFNGRAYVLLPNLPPNAPVISQSSVGDNTITIALTTASSDTVDGTITKYNAYVNGTLHDSDITLSQGGTFQITGLSTGTTYNITLKAKDSIGALSVASNTISATTTGAPANTAPTTPTGLASSNITSTGFTITATPSTDAQGNTITYNLYKNGTIYQSGASTPSFNVTGQTASSTATWTMSATDGSLESNQSSGLSVTTLEANVDRQNPESNYTTVNSTSGTNSGTGDKLGFSFTPTVTKAVDKIKLFGKARTDINHAGDTGNVKISIQTDGGNKPSGTLVDSTYSVTLAYDSNVNFHDVIADFTSSVQLTSGTRYWVVLEIVNASTTNAFYFTVKASASSAYSGLTMYSSSAGVWNTTTVTPCFVEYTV